MHIWLTLYTIGMPNTKVSKKKKKKRLLSEIAKTVATHY